MSLTTEEIEKQQYPESFIFFANATAVAKTLPKGKPIPSRLPVAWDVNISNAASVKIYGSNISQPATGTQWGAPLKTCTASEKFIFENEPWLYWMVEIESITGTVNVIAAA